MVNKQLIPIQLFCILLLFSSKFGRAIAKKEKGKDPNQTTIVRPSPLQHESPSTHNNPPIDLNLSLAQPSVVSSNLHDHQPIDLELHLTPPSVEEPVDLQLRMGRLSTNSPNSSSSKNKMLIGSSSLQFPLHNDPMELTMTNTYQGISSSHFTEQIQPSEMPLPGEQNVQSNFHHQNILKSSNIAQQTLAEKQIGPSHSLQSQDSAFNVNVKGKNQVGASLPSNKQHQSSAPLNVQPERPNLSERHQENQETRPSSLQLFPPQDPMEMIMTNTNQQSDPSSQQNEHDKGKQIQPRMPPPREHVDPNKVHQHDHGTNPSTNTLNDMGFIYSDFFPTSSEHSGTNPRSEGQGAGSSSSHVAIGNLRPPLSNSIHLERNFSKKSLQRQFSKISHDLVTSKKTGQNPIQSSHISSPPEYHPPKYSRSHSDINPRKSVYSEDLKEKHPKIYGFLDDLNKKLENKNEDEENIKYRKFVDSFHQQISGQQVGPSQMQKQSSPTSGSASNKNKRKNNEDGQQQQEIVHILDSDDEQEGQDNGHGGHLKHGQNKREEKGKGKDVEGSRTKNDKKGH